MTTNNASSPAGAAMNVDAYTEAYIKLRDARSKLRKEYQDRDAAFAADMQKIETALLGALETVGANSLTTAHGNVRISHRQKAICHDWEKLYTWIVENNVPHVLQKRLSAKELVSLAEQGHTAPAVSMETTPTIIVTRRTK